MYRRLPSRRQILLAYHFNCCIWRRVQCLVKTLTSLHNNCSLTCPAFPTVLHLVDQDVPFQRSRPVPIIPEVRHDDVAT